MDKESDVEFGTRQIQVKGDVAMAMKHLWLRNLFSSNLNSCVWAFGDRTVEVFDVWGAFWL